MKSFFLFILSIVATCVGAASVNNCVFVSSHAAVFSLDFFSEGNATICMGTASPKESMPLVLNVSRNETCIAWQKSNNDTIRFCADSDPRRTVSFEFLNYSDAKIVRTVLTKKRGARKEAIVLGEINVWPASVFTNLTFCNASYNSPISFDCKSTKKWSAMKEEWCCREKSIGCRKLPTRMQHSGVLLNNMGPTLPPHPHELYSSGACTVFLSCFIKMIFFIAFRSVL